MQASEGVYEDLSGPEMRRLLLLMNEEQAALRCGATSGSKSASFFVEGRIDACAIVADEIGMYVPHNNRIIILSVLQ